MTKQSQQQSSQNPEPKGAQTESETHSLPTQLSLSSSSTSQSSSPATSQPSSSSYSSQSSSTISSSSFSPQDVLLIEAILFAAGTRISVSRIMELSKIPDRQKIDAILHSLAQKHTGEHSAFDLVHMGDDWKMTVKRAFLSVAEKIAPDAELPKSIIETLAILAWKAPMSQSDLVKIRSNKAYDHIEELQNRGFITRERRGRTYILKLTTKFFDYFDVQGKKQVEKLFERFDGKENLVAQRQIADVERQKKAAADKELQSQTTLASLGTGPRDDEITIKKIKDENKSKQREFFDDIDSRLNKIVSKTSSVKDAIAEIAKSDTVSAMQTVAAGVDASPVAENGDTIDDEKTETDADVSDNSASDAGANPENSGDNE